jgi:hypothetical protein
MGGDSLAYLELCDAFTYFVDYTSDFAVTKETRILISRSSSYVGFHVCTAGCNNLYFNNHFTMLWFWFLDVFYSEVTQTVNHSRFHCCHSYTSFT